MYICLGVHNLAGQVGFGVLVERPTFCPELVSFHQELVRVSMITKLMLFSIRLSVI